MCHLMDPLTLHCPPPAQPPASCLLTDDLSLQLTTYLQLPQKNCVKGKNFLVVSLPFIDAFPHTESSKNGNIGVVAPICPYSFKGFLYFSPQFIFSTYLLVYRRAGECPHSPSSISWGLRVWWCDAGHVQCWVINVQKTFTLSHTPPASTTAAGKLLSIQNKQ